MLVSRNFLCVPSINYNTCPPLIMRKDGLDAKDLLSSVSLSVTLLKEDEGRILSEALVCMGEARLALFSASITSSRKIKRDQLIYAKEIYVASVSVHICRSLSYCCRIESLTSSKHIRL